jgi:hypothetical protein
MELSKESIQKMYFNLLKTDFFWHASEFNSASFVLIFCISKLMAFQGHGTLGMTLTNSHGTSLSLGRFIRPYLYHVFIHVVLF